MKCPFFRAAALAAPVLIFVLVLFICPVLLYARDARPDWALAGDEIKETEGQGLVLRSNPSGARVFIDGIERGMTPVRLPDLRPGYYLVGMVKEGYVERRFRVRLGRNSLVEISVKLEEARGTVLVKIKGGEGAPDLVKLPLRPFVSADVEAVETPVSGGVTLDLAAGIRTVGVRAFGWEGDKTTVYVGEGEVATVDFALKPAAFALSNTSLSRRLFNPANPGALGTTVFNFEVSSPGTGTFLVFNAQGEKVFEKQLAGFSNWFQSISWDGRDNFGELCPDGEYSLALRLRSVPYDNSAPVVEEESLKAVIDSSKEIFPLTLSSGKAGLLFVPGAFVLPGGSFQIEGSLLFGSPPEAGGAWRSLPFAAAFRFSPLDSLEVSASLNFVPAMEKDAGIGFGGAVKWGYFTMPGFFEAAAGAQVSWVKDTSASPFGLSSGIELFFPLSIKAGRVFSFLFTPAALWTGDKGFPWDGTPRLLVSGGVMAKLTYFSAGLSARASFRFTGEEKMPPPVLLGAELKFFPPPSNLVFSVSGGLWLKNPRAGGFGGLGIGMIY
jgi:hypothetical protein